MINKLCTIFDDFEFNAASRIDAMYIKHHYNTVQFLMDVPFKFYCLAI